MLKVLSVGKEKQSNTLPIFVEREIKAFEKGGFPVEVKGVALKGKGILGYIKSYFQLKKIIKREQPDIIHAHYSFSGVISILASPKRNVVVTFLGSDVFAKTILVRLSKWFVSKKAAHIIVVSEKIRATFNQQQKITIIPQGINIEVFKPIKSKTSAENLDWNSHTINILFPSSQNRYEKNYGLAKEAVQVLSKEFSISLHTLENVNPNQVSTYLNTADIILLTSKWEGSSNITKEAMACNSIVVSTDVGDARMLFENTQGYFISDHTIESVVYQIRKALNFIKEGKTPNGRDRIIHLGLDDNTIANNIFNVYKSVLSSYRTV